MSRTIIKNPSREDFLKWGILSHVEKQERERILALPHGQFKPAIKSLEKEVDLVKFPRKRKSIIEDYSNKPVFKPQPIKEPSHEDDPEDDIEPF